MFIYQTLLCKFFLLQNLDFGASQMQLLTYLLQSTISLFLLEAYR